MDSSLVKQLRERTGASIMACKRALEKGNGDLAKAEGYLKEDREAIIAKTADRNASQGLVASYIHNNKRVGSLVELHCETDFVAHTKEFQYLAAEIALHIAGMNPANLEELLAQPYVRDASRTINDLILQAIGSVGEKIAITRFVRYEIRTSNQF